MTKKRYEIVFLNGLDRLCSIQDTEAEIPTFYNDLGYINHIKPVCDLLNEQDSKIQRYKLAYNKLSLYVDANFDEYMTQKKLNERIRELEKENAKLLNSIVSLRAINDELRRIDGDVE